MTSKKQTAANKANSKRSTGPKTVKGKLISSTNATKHGLRSLSPVIPNVETPEDWEAHRDAVVDDLVPVGYLEEELAGRVAFILWRLRRVVRYETGVLTNRMEDVEKDAAEGIALAASIGPVYGSTDRPLFDPPSGDLSPEGIRRRMEEAVSERESFQSFTKAKDSKKLDQETAETILEAVSQEMALDPWVFLDEEMEETGGEEITSWTVGTLRAVVSRIAADPDSDGTEERAYRNALRSMGEKTLKAILAVKELDHRIIQIQRMRTSLPTDTGDKVQKHEAHLERSLLRNLHELQRLQATRLAGGGPPPHALDVTVSTGA